MLGIAISGATAHSATQILEPLRDLFAAIFFVVFGLNTDPASIPPVLAWALLLAVLTAATKMATGFWAAKRAGIGLPGRFRTGATLIARGEFSIVIAGLAVASGVVPQELAALATAYVLIMAIAGPLAARFVEPLVSMLRRPSKQQAVGTIRGA
jgi:CPA2 family monovalent cation:H+ antiporter-2